MASTLHGLLARAASRHPEAVAVVDGDRSLTYRELDQRSNQLAWHLHEGGVGRGDRVGIYLEKSIEALTAVYAVMKAGGAYVPIDSTAPTTRSGKIASDCGLRVLVSSTAMAARWDELAEAGARLELIVSMDGVPPEGSAAGGAAVIIPALTDEPTDPPPVRCLSLDLAYILYTSGSTGDPKGVKLSHRNCLGFVEWAARELELSVDDRLSSHAPLHFDLSTFDLFAAALVAARVVLVPRRASLFPTELVKLIERTGITVWYSVPSILTLLATRGGLAEGSLPSLRVVLFAGEVFPTKYLRLLMRQLPAPRFCNLYGPTETNVCTWYDVPWISDDEVEPIPIGIPIDDVEAIVVTADGTPAGVDEVGDLLVRGPTVMQGYWGDPARTERSLVRHPFDPEAPDLLYRTGDLVAWRPDGSLRFLGRADDQVKSRGYRIELGEVEAALHAHPSVLECVVVARPDDVFGSLLIALAVVEGDLTPPELKDHCASLVPRYMVPEEIHLRDDLPKTSTGKIDRRRLAAELEGSG